ncbi:hypothetical protein LTR49_022842 [Elasticomyces elasticus]|nr:hypothetical protein LTR49_022842 [Elasticomyces elasticus]KAK5748194.1 hypothetical protein LTS12_021760 [Elasticomyces elasticus]
MRELHCATSMLKSFLYCSDEDATAMLAHWRRGGCVDEIVGPVLRRPSSGEDAETPSMGNEDSAPSAQLSHTRSDSRGKSPGSKESTHSPVDSRDNVLHDSD